MAAVCALFAQRAGIFRGLERHRAERERASRNIDRHRTLVNHLVLIADLIVAAWTWAEIERQNRVLSR